MKKYNIVVQKHHLYETMFAHNTNQVFLETDFLFILRRSSQAVNNHSNNSINNTISINTEINELDLLNVFVPYNTEVEI